MNISFSLSHLVHFCDGVRKKETHSTDEMSTFGLQKTWIAAGWMLGVRGKARGAQHVPCGSFSTPLS